MDILWKYTRSFLTWRVEGPLEESALPKIKSRPSKLLAFVMVISLCNIINNNNVMVSCPFLSVMMSSNLVNHSINTNTYVLVKLANFVDVTDCTDCFLKLKYMEL